MLDIICIVFFISYSQKVILRWWENHSLQQNGAKMSRQEENTYLQNLLLEQESPQSVRGFLFPYPGKVQQWFKVDDDVDSPVVCQTERFHLTVRVFWL